MLTIREYKQAESIQQAYELNQKRSARIIGGMMWLKMSRAGIMTAIDLSGLALDKIEEQEDCFLIGAMCSLRQLELHAGLEHAFQGALQAAVSHIVGVQFRNTATVGGSVYSRFGFSDVTACLLALDTSVELYPSGWVSLEQFMQMPYGDEILVRVRINKDGRKTAYCSHRQSATDLPVLAACVSLKEGLWHGSVGARPARAVLKTAAAAVPENREEIVALAERLCKGLSFGGNLRGSAAYRAHLAQVLVSRAIAEICGKEQG